MNRVTVESTLGPSNVTVRVGVANPPGTWYVALETGATVVQFYPTAESLDDLADALRGLAQSMRSRAVAA